jgi:hypothetical protein
MKEFTMKINQKNISKLMGLSLITILALQACSMPTTTPTAIIPQSETGADLVAPAEELTEAEVAEETLSEDPSATETIPTKEEMTPTDEEVLIPQAEENAAITLDNGLTQAEVDSLVFMREEEKLAHDVYLTLYDTWGLPIFSNIAGSEQAHTDAVGNLLITFNIPDPADTSPAGVFVNEDLQGLYDQLTELGAQSIADALKVGAAIEEIDILDLQESLELIEDESIQRVYENLLRGSENHLRAFTATLENQTGEVYEPQYMDSDAYQEIISDSTNNGGRGNGRRP